MPNYYNSLFERSCGKTVNREWWIMRSIRNTPHTQVKPYVYRFVNKYFVKPDMQYIITHETTHNIYGITRKQLVERLVKYNDRNIFHI